MTLGHRLLCASMAEPQTDARPARFFILESDGPVATLTFNRPERRNGLNAEVLEELEHLLRVVRDDRRTKALILSASSSRIR